jgi:DNA polymerase-1
LQLIGPTIQVYDPMREKTYGNREVEERYGVPPRAMVELMSLTGDPIDNIPGVPGVGEKTASSLIKEFGTVEDLLTHLDRVKQPRLREALKAHAEQIRRNRSLVTIRTDLPFPLSCEALRRQEPDRERLQALFRELEFTRLLALVEGEGRTTP